MRSFVYSLPAGIDEAAEIDGCSFYGVFFKIILPLLKPILATIGVLGFLGLVERVPSAHDFHTEQSRTASAGCRGYRP